MLVRWAIPNDRRLQKSSLLTSVKVGYVESGICLCTDVSLNKRMLVVKGIRNWQTGSAYGEVVYGECGSSEESKMKMEMKLD